MKEIWIMKKQMLLSLLVGMSIVGVIADQSDNASKCNRSSHRQVVQLTDAQKAKVKAILAKFDASSLTAADARAIHEEFRKAGLKAGPAMKQTIEEAGFDPERLRTLAPPPPRKEGKQDQAN